MMEKPSAEELGTAVRVLDWVAVQVEEECRPDIVEPIRFSRAFTERLRQGAERAERGG